MLPFDDVLPFVAYPPVHAERDRILEALAAKTERAREKFAEDAEAFVLTYLKASPLPVSSETLTLACKAAGIVPHDDRAFGPVYMRLARTGKLCKAGSCQRQRGHGTSGGTLWRLA